MLYLSNVSHTPEGTPDDILRGKDIAGWPDDHADILPFSQVRRDRPG